MSTQPEEAQEARGVAALTSLPAPAPDLPEVWSGAPWLRRVPVRTPTLPPATHTNVYVVGEGALLVVDPASPYADEQARLLEVLRGLEAQGQRVRALLLTHHHADHCGGADALRQALGVPLYAHRLTAERVARRGLLVDEHVAAGAVLPFGPRGLLALHTPGHAPGHLCLWDQAGGGMIVGDMVASQGTIVVDPEDDGDMAQYLRELARLEALARAEASARRLWPAHGCQVVDGPALLAHYQRHRLQREAKVVAALQACAGTEAEAAPLEALLPRAYDDVPVELYPLAARALRAHLLKLLAEGRARRTQRLESGGDSERWSWSG